MQCYCGSGQAFEACCAPLIEGKQGARDAESLMRSRYSAFAAGAGEYLVETTAPERRVEEDAALIRAHAQQTTWLGLDVLEVSQKEKDAVVVFKAYYRDAEGKVSVHHEKSRFVKQENRWFYLDGILYDTQIGRNDPCPCGSGRKYKKCCMLR